MFIVWFISEVYEQHCTPIDLHLGLALLSMKGLYPHCAALL